MSNLAWFTIACCLLLFSSAPAEADPLGRFFTTAKERERLDQWRQRPAGREAAEVDAAPARQPAAAAVLERMTLKGLVYRYHHGRHRAGTVWIDEVGRDDAADAALPHLLIEDNGSGKTHLIVRPPGTENAYRLQVGQSLNPNTGVISDLAVKQAGQVGLSLPVAE